MLVIFWIKQCNQEAWKVNCNSDNLSEHNGQQEHNFLYQHTESKPNFNSLYFQNLKVSLVAISSFFHNQSSLWLLLLARKNQHHKVYPLTKLFTQYPSTWGRHVVVTILISLLHPLTSYYKSNKCNVERKGDGFSLLSWACLSYLNHLTNPVYGYAWLGHASQPASTCSSDF